MSIKFNERYDPVLPVIGHMLQVVVVVVVAILSEVDQAVAVSLVGTHHGPGMRWDASSWSCWAAMVSV